MSLPRETSTSEPWRREAARELLREYRAALLELNPRGLTKRETVIGYAVMTRVKNLAERRLTGFRKGIEFAFDASGPMGQTERARELSETIFHDRRAGAAVLVHLQNDACDARVLSEHKALALLAKQKLKRTCMEKLPRPPAPSPRFSPQKFRDLVAAGKITQADYDACLEPASPRCTTTLDVPPELDEAIAAALFAGAGE